MARPSTVRRAMVGLALAGALTTALAGCGRTATPTSAPAPTSASQPSTTGTAPATANTPDPVDSIDQLLNQAEQDADSVN